MSGLRELCASCSGAMQDEEGNASEDVVEYDDDGTTPTCEAPNWVSNVDEAMLRHQLVKLEQYN